MATHSSVLAQVALVVKNPPAVQEPQETWVQTLGQEDPPGGEHGAKTFKAHNAKPRGLKFLL